VNLPECVERTTRRLYACRDVFEPRLISGDLDGLAGLRRTALLQDALPALPREFVIVPHADERPAGTGVLQVGVGEIALPNGSIAVDGFRPVEIAGLTRVGDAANLVDRPVIARRAFFRILNDLVD